LDLLGPSRETQHLRKAGFSCASETLILCHGHLQSHKVKILNAGAFPLHWKLSQGRSGGGLPPKPECHFCSSVSSLFFMSELFSLIIFNFKLMPLRAICVCVSVCVTITDFLCISIINELQYWPTSSLLQRLLRYMPFNQGFCDSVLLRKN
jgi:hypothetical protein